jgi:hypothetical protein
VQVVPHITDAIQDWVERVGKIPVDDSGETPDVCIVELGGTVGDIESAPFIEAMRQFQFRVGPDNFFLIHVSLIPVVGSVGEQKTKPTQASVRDLRGLGLSPDLVGPLDLILTFRLLVEVANNWMEELEAKFPCFVTFHLKMSLPFTIVPLYTTYLFCCIVKEL